MFLALAPLTIGYRIVSADSPLFVMGIGTGIFLLCAFYGPAISTIQELSPPSARATLIAFNILCLNVIGLGVGITGTGWLIDMFRTAGNSEPYTNAALTMSLVSMLALPAFFLLAGGSTATRQSWRRREPAELRLIAPRQNRVGRPQSSPAPLRGRRGNSLTQHNAGRRDCPKR